MQVITLGYHDIVPAAARERSGFQGAGPNRYKVAPDDFGDHLDALAADGATAGRVADGAAFAITFDDGGAGAVHHAAPALARHRWPGHFFVVTDRIGVPGFLDEEGIQALDAGGHVVGSHSHSHAIMTRLRPGELREEWTRSKARLEDVLGHEVVTAAVPRGYATRAVLEAAAAAGYQHVFTSEPWTSPRPVAGALAYGRFAVTETTSRERVVELARADRVTVGRVAAGWYARKIAKRAAGPVYERVRTAVLSRTR